MNNYGLLKPTATPGTFLIWTVTRAENDEAMAGFGVVGTDWINVSIEGGWIGWTWDGADTFPPVPPPPVTRYILDLAEWTESWTQDEWENLQGAAYERGYVVDWPGHPLDGVSPSQGVQRKLRQLFADETRRILRYKLTNSFDVRSEKADQFYGYLESVSFIDSARRTELQAGVTE